MFRTYVPRPYTIRALPVTTDNYRDAAAWIANTIADERGVDIVEPGETGQGRPRLTFRLRDRRFPVPLNVPIPGYLVRGEWDDGSTDYRGDDADDFDVSHQRAED
ncbi:hypothetical protein CLV63_11238 [Murinocardiopsis flavida]|uniref:Uncharacterized protein n=1 Tax=Murinocardiopsis flavida TaxID=645275 RepID=A0A2P8DG27_9ACTN|nr:hypothetical protein [Murinocardiopsis flavida]PSK96156.1 hypothetical protein CLV63_11238 [Murinocardiopsis flavida]